MVIAWVRWVGFREYLWGGIAASTVLTMFLLAALSVRSALTINRTDQAQVNALRLLERSEQRYRLLFEDYSSDPQGLLDSCKSLPNRSYPFWRIVCGTTEIGPAESLFLASQKHHDGNTR